MKPGKPVPEHWRGLVVDTHVWVWAVEGDPRAQALATTNCPLILSAISVWEVAMLTFKGRLELLPDTESWVTENLSPPFELEPLHPEVSLESCRLAGFHGDQADRLIVATARQLGLPLVTADENIREWNRKKNVVRCLGMDLLENPAR